MHVVTTPDEMKAELDQAITDRRELVVGYRAGNGADPKAFLVRPIRWEQGRFGHPLLVCFDTVAGHHRSLLLRRTLGVEAAAPALAAA